MAKPTIFNVSAIWDAEASVWSGHCDEIPAAADSPTLDGLMEKISRMTVDLAPDNHPDIEPDSIFHPNHRLARSDARGGLSGAAFRPPLARFVETSRLFSRQTRMRQP
jgi:hypothetical protein